MHDFYSKRGGGVYRRWYHHIPLKGSGSIARFRRTVKGASSTIKENASGAKRFIKKIHRVVCDGFKFHLLASERPCYSPNCTKCADKDYKSCTTSHKTKCTEIVLEPKSDDRTPAPKAGDLATIGHRIGEGAVEGELIAMETESDETVFWIVQATRSYTGTPPAAAPRNYKCPNLGSDVEFDYGRHNSSNQPKCVEVERLKPVTTLRGESSVRLLEVDKGVKPFLVPTHLLRQGKLNSKLKQVATSGRATRRNKNADLKKSFELTRDFRLELELKCRHH